MSPNASTRLARFPRSQRAFASLIAILILAMFASLSLAYAAMTNANHAQAANQARAQAALFQAESGMSFLLRKTRGLKLPASTTDATLLTNMGTELGTALAGIAAVSGDATQILVSPIATDNQGSTFGARYFRSGANVRMTVTGSARGASRNVSVDYVYTSIRSDAFNYGVASRSRIELSGQAAILGKSTMQEASVLSTKRTDDGGPAVKLEPVLSMDGKPIIHGDVFLTDPTAVVEVDKNCEIAGVSGSNPAIYNHIHWDAGDVEFPQPDPTVFEPFATHTLTAAEIQSINNSTVKTWKNIRIPANSNPTFASDTTLQGVIYIEQPNKISFAGKVNVTGVIVTQDAGQDNYDANNIKFSGQVNASGLASLPDTPEWATLRQMDGTFLLAPGFSADFSGQFGTVSGTMAAECFRFSGQAEGNIKGSVLNYSQDVDFVMSGQGKIVIDRSNMPEQPAGFRSQGVLTLISGSYQEK